MEFSELTNKELKCILRENQVKNYSNLSKKELVKKVNNLIKVQNGGKSGKGKNGKKKKYTLKDLIGAGPPGMPTNENSKNLPNFKITPSPPPPPPPLKNQATLNAKAATGSSQNSAPSNPIVATAPLQNSVQQNAQVASQNLVQQNAQVASQNSATLNPIVATAPALSKNEIKEQENREFNRQTNEAKRASLENKGNNKGNNKGKNECGTCSIL